MNSVKYKNAIYETRNIEDLRELINSSAELFGENPAFLTKNKPSDEYRPIKYKALKHDVDCLGTGFIANGLKGARIGVIGENSYSWFISYLATTNGTGIVVPLDRELPVGELENLIHRANVEAIVYSKKVENKIAEIKENIPSVKMLISMSDEHDIPESIELSKLLEMGEIALEVGDRRFLDAEIDKNAMCALLFTSGTTDMAKGVMLCHRGIAKNVMLIAEHIGLQAPDTGLSVLPMHHSYEMSGHILEAMYQGVCIAFCDGLKYVSKNLDEAKVSVLLAVPLIFESIHKKVMKKAAAEGKLEKLQKAIAISKKYKLYNHPWITKKMFADVHKGIGSHLRLFVSGGAAIDPKVVGDFEAMGIAMVQGYGLTESSPLVAVDKDRYTKNAAVGYISKMTEVRIVDVDENGVGEIISKGPSTMLGYYENPEATAQAIRDGWLYTGDYGYIDKDGFLYISGRKKGVIVAKNGKNVFPEEVEYYIQQESEYVEEVLVYGVFDPEDNNMVIIAEIYPNMAMIKENFGAMSEEEMQKFFKGIVDGANDKMPIFKRATRVQIREIEFEKTTTKKIRRFAESNMTYVV